MAIFLLDYSIYGAINIRPHPGSHLQRSGAILLEPFALSQRPSFKLLFQKQWAARLGNSEGEGNVEL